MVKAELKFQIVSEHKGDEAGIKSSTFKIVGDYFSLVEKESGMQTCKDFTIRLVLEDTQVLPVCGFIRL